MSSEAERRIEEAAHRSRAYYSSSHWRSPVLIVADNEELACAYLAEHLADDDQEITHAWLQQLQFIGEPDETVGVINKYAGVWLTYMVGGWRIRMGDWWEFGPQTRGDLRRLCQAIHIKLPNPSEEEQDVP